MRENGDRGVRECERVKTRLPGVAEQKEHIRGGSGRWKPGGSGNLGSWAREDR